MPFRDDTNKTEKARLETYQGLKGRIHRKLLEKLDFSTIDVIPAEVLRKEVARAVESLIVEDNTPLSEQEKEGLIVEIQHEIFGLGPIEPLLADPEISDILVNRHNQVYVEKKGKLSKASLAFRDDNHLMQIIDRIVSKVGRRVDESSPYVDARLPDGSRVHAIIPPIALDGPVLSIRRFGVEPLRMADILAFGTLTPEMAKILEGCVKARLNFLVSGGTGSGKTTLLNILTEYVPATERIITIEDSAELHLKQEHVVRLETRPPNIEGKGQVTQRDLVRNSLRMRPDRVILGEVRGGEALDMLQAMNTGHDGSLSTIHANSARDAMSRLETMVLMAGMDLPERAIREQVASAINVVVHLARMSDGSRKVTSMTEIVGLEGSTITMQDIFTFEQEGIGTDGRIIGKLMPTGIRPKFMNRLKLIGYELPAKIFERIK